MQLSANIYRADVCRNLLLVLRSSPNSAGTIHTSTHSMAPLTRCSLYAKLSWVSSQELHGGFVCLLSRQENWVRMHLNILAYAFKNSNTCICMCTQRARLSIISLNAKQDHVDAWKTGDRAGMTYLWMAAALCRARRQHFLKSHKNLIHSRV